MTGEAQYFTGQAPVFWQIQWTGDNLAAIQALTDFVLTDNSDGTFSFETAPEPFGVTVTVQNGQWVWREDRGEPPNVGDDPGYTSANAQALPDAGPFNYTITEAGS